MRHQIDVCIVALERRVEHGVYYIGMKKIVINDFLKKHNIQRGASNFDEEVKCINDRCHDVIIMNGYDFVKSCKVCTDKNDIYLIVEC